MNMLRILVLSVLSLLFQGNVFGTSIAYSGFICSKIDVNDITSSGIPIESRFEVIENVGGGMFRLRLTGGIPRIVSDDSNVCIDKATAIGFSGGGLQVGDLPRPLESIDATAYFSGQELVIVVNSMFTDLSAKRGAFSSFSTSKILAITNTLIFGFDSQASSFSLKKVIRNAGFTHTETKSESSIPFQETVLPSFNGVSPDRPLILTPTSSIVYSLQ